MNWLVWELVKVSIDQDMGLLGCELVRVRVGQGVDWLQYGLVRVWTGLCHSLHTLQYTINNQPTNQPTNPVHTICHLHIHSYIKTLTLLPVSNLVYGCIIRKCAATASHTHMLPSILPLCCAYLRITSSIRPCSSHTTQEIRLQPPKK